MRAEASWAHLATGGGDETIDDLEAGVRRVRGGVEVTRALSGPGGLTLTPFGAVSTRHDGGAGQTGVGLEVAGGLRLRGGRVQLEAQGRRLVLHSATAYEEQGVSLAATVGSSPYEPGLTLSLRPNWGAGGMGAETLWQDQIQTYMPGSAYDQTGIDTRLGYGLRLGRDGLVTPFGSYGQRQNSGRRLQVGTLVGTLGQTPGSLHGPLQIEVSGERHDRPGGNADHRFSMFGVLNLGGGGPAYGTATGIDPRLHVPVSDLSDTEDLPDTVFAPPAPAPDAAPPLDEARTPALAMAAVGSAVTPPAALSPEVADADAAASDRTPVEVPVPVTEYAGAAPVEADLPLSGAVADTATMESGFESSEPAVTLTARRNDVDVPDALKAPAMATEPASRAPAVRAPMAAGAAVTGRGERRTAVPVAARYAPTAPGRELRPAPATEIRAARGRRSSPRSNQPPGFSSPTYAFETPSRRGSRGEVAPLGFVVARDPNRDPVTYSLDGGGLDPLRGRSGQRSHHLPGTGPAGNATLRAADHSARYGSADGDRDRDGHGGVGLHRRARPGSPCDQRPRAHRASPSNDCRATACGRASSQRRRADRGGPFSHGHPAYRGSSCSRRRGAQGDGSCSHRHGATGCASSCSRLAAHRDGPCGCDRAAPRQSPQIRRRTAYRGSRCGADLQGPAGAGRRAVERREPRGAAYRCGNGAGARNDDGG